MKAINRHSVSLVAVWFIIEKIGAQVCPRGKHWPNPGNRGNGQNGFNLDVSFLMIVDGIVDCFGIIEQWEMRTRDDIFRCRQNMIYQVWRPDPNRNAGYVLVGENRINLEDWPACRTNIARWSVPVQYRIPIQPNDIIGWTDDGMDGRPLRHQTGNTVSTLIARSPWSCRVGASCSWLVSDPNIVEDTNMHLLRPSTREGNRPYFINLPITVTINADQPAGYLLYRAKALFQHNAQKVVIPRTTYQIFGGGCSAHCVIERYTGEVTVINTIREADSGCVINIRALPEGYPDIDTYRVESSLTIQVEPFKPSIRLDDPPNSVFIDTGNMAIAANELIFTPASTCVYAGDCTRFPMKCFIVTSEPSFPPFEISDPSTPEVRLRFNNVQDLRNWQGPERYTAGIVCSHSIAITRKENLIVTFGNLRMPPKSDLPSYVTIPETQLRSDGFIHCISTVPMPGDVRSTQILYEIIYIYPHYATDWFDIINVGNDGCVYITSLGERNLDYFRDDSYVLMIDIIDVGAPHNPTLQNLTIEISWRNQAPIFGARGLNGYISRIPEKSPIGTALPDVLLDASDRDTQRNDWISYSIEDLGLPPFGAIHFVASNITSRVYVDREIVITPGEPYETFHLEIHVFDSYGLNARATLDVTVYDINNHAPAFDIKTYNGTVSENDVGPKYVTTVTATDADSGDNALIRYSIIEPVANHYFEVGVESGIISLIQPISYIDHPNITFTVMATDQGDPALSDTATVFVNVIEVNNHDPELHPAYYSVEARSDLPVGDFVVQITATDKDSRSVSTPSFHFLTIQDDFAILRISGNVKTAKPLRTWETYVLGVNVVNNGQPSMHSDPAYVRIDTYDAQATLFDIYLNIPLEEFLPLKDSFLNEINSLLAPWTVFIEKVLLDKDVTVVTCYAMSSYPPVYDMYSPKVFVHRNIAMGRLRVQMMGDANQPIREPPFAAFEPFRVMPTYPNWFIDTPVGIATLVILCLLLALAISLFILLCKKKGWLCFTPKKIAPLTTVPSYPEPDDEFQLNYGRPRTPRKRNLYSN